MNRTIKCRTKKKTSGHIRKAKNALLLAAAHEVSLYGVPKCSINQLWKKYSHMIGNIYIMKNKQAFEKGLIEKKMSIKMMTGLYSIYSEDYCINLIWNTLGFC